MAPKTHNFLLYQGDTHLFKVLLTADSEPIDLSQATFWMDIVAGDGSVIRPEITVAGNAVTLLFPAAAQAAIESAGSLEGRLKLLERDQASISEYAVDLAKQKAALEEALTQLVAADSAVKSLTSQLEILRIQFAAAEESSEIEALDQRIADISVELEKAKQAAAEAEESSELAELQQKIAELAALSESQSQITAEIADLRNLLGLRKCEKIHLTQSMWADGGYTWAKVNFQNTYKDPKVYVSVEHPALAVLFLNHNICAKTENSVMIRSNFDKTKIDTSYSIYLYVEEWQDSIG